MDKLYVGKGKLVKKPWGDELTLTFTQADCDKISTSIEQSGKKYARFDVKQRKLPDEYGNTHYMVLNTYQPPQKNSEGNGTGADQDFPF